MWQNELEAMIAAGGAPCRACGQRMLKVDGCTWTHVKCGSRYYRRIKDPRTARSARQGRPGRSVSQEDWR